jgi:hypothetical protein
MAEFWLQISADRRVNRKLFYKYLNEKQNLPFKKPNYPKLRKANYAYNPFARPHYGRFIGNKSLLKAILTRVRDYVDVSRIPYSFISPNKPVLLEHFHCIEGILYLNEIMDRTDSEISE